MVFFQTLTQVATELPSFLLQIWLGQYLAFIYYYAYYAKLNGCPPAKVDMQRYFKVTPPTVHNMVVTLEKLGLIERVPGQSRTICMLLPREELPDLEQNNNG